MNTFEHTPPLENQESREEPVEYLYHMVPSRVVGDTLSPLNELKEEYPDVYEAAAAKYQGREELMQEKVPIGNALWNDVLHLTAIHPTQVKQALIEAGADIPDREWMWYKIPVSLLEPERSVIWSGHFAEMGDSDQEYQPLNEEGLKSAATLPSETKEYYKKKISVGERPLLFMYAPHIFYRGNISLADCEKISI